MEYFEDLELGKSGRFGKFDVTREEVIAFASRYDPQPFHLDDEAAALTHFGKIAASGWQTCAMTMAMIVARQTAKGHQGLGSPGVEELRFLKPVYPGDTLSCESEITEKRRSGSRPEMGVFRSRTTTYNQHGEAVLSFTSSAFVRVREV